MSYNITNLASFFSLSLIKKLSPVQHQQIRNKWANFHMIKDYKKRLVLKEKNIDRLRNKVIRKNDILPPELREVAAAEAAAMPRASSNSQIIARCCLTSRPKGVIHRFRVSRMIFRNLADYNKLCGVQRAMW